MGKHKYLNKLGIKSNNPSIFNPKRFFNFRELKQIATHGFATWQEVGNLDCTSAMWLYEHLKVYKNEAIKIIDLDAAKFNIPVLYDLPEEKIEYWNNNRYFPITLQEERIEYHTQVEAIDYIIKYLEYFLTEPEFPVDNITEDSVTKDNIMLQVTMSEVKQWECVRCAFKIYAIIIGSMWI